MQVMLRTISAFYYDFAALCDIYGLEQTLSEDFFGSEIGSPSEFEFSLHGSEGLFDPISDLPAY